MANDLFYLYDEAEDTRTRFVSFTGEATRFDLAITTTNRFYGKAIVINIQNGRSAIIGHDDLEEEGYLEFAFNLNEREAEELKAFLEAAI
ncbi:MULTISPECIES: DUF3055 domain-containing protein [Brevibacillus]|uniref:DUF3055 domain-containing protein n=1 Tax=Brevibacillus brevis TaxID=1393 RepID=A0A0J6BJV3_BREBE|nr:MULTISPECIES: DUF3055 domain-containing protein [Brevibacillus]AWX58035.1 DUF3055 domain-containing protein [Brevibacillus brevis]MBY0086194.1 DUF3055 domain-containing protein [Brevibacillus brevis]MCC8438111.1 DUF3055 domain-containing protein [Brevibacillus sp. M2.1A]MCE0450177.1 DUF3055 domain-containing protein [Brevibacillus sp. AF8]MCM3144424.1 DUF3055 domain-containing protein [Brevibacillus sp. MER 51]